jgi:hypothetical protein
MGVVLRKRGIYNRQIIETRQKMPPIYYKYRPINFHTEQLLRNQEIYFSFGYEYNDPFDSKVRIDPSASVEEVLATLEETPIPENTKLFLRQKFKNNEIHPELHLHSVYEVAKTTIMSSCFSSEPANVLMWSHYADSHRGICIGLANISDEKVPAIKFGEFYFKVHHNHVEPDNIPHKVSGS